MITDIENIEKSLITLQERKDDVMTLSRDIIRLSGKMITKIHAEDKAETQKLFKDLRVLVKKLKKAEPGFEYNSLQAHQEYVEAASLYVMVNELRIPSMKELGEDEVSYLLGLLDAVGELKRHTFEYLMKNDLKRAQKYYDLMVEIYDSTVPLRFANSLVPDFRKKQDVARIQIERMNSEMFLSQQNRRSSK